jgi:hypothetical protein
MFSEETWFALLMCTCMLVLPLVVDDRGTGSWLQIPVAAILMYPVLRAMLYFASAADTGSTKSARGSVLGSEYARSLDVTLRKAFPAPVIDAPILDVGVARVRFFSSRSSVCLRLRLKSHRLDRAPWLHLEGADSFWLPPTVVGAKSLTLRKPCGSWRYWQPPWRQADLTIESPDFCASLPPTREELVLTSRPGHLLIRADCSSSEASVEFENAVRLAIAWVTAVQQARDAR